MLSLGSLAFSLGCGCCCAPSLPKFAMSKEFSKAVAKLVRTLRELIHIGEIEARCEANSKPA